MYRLSSLSSAAANAPYSPAFQFTNFRKNRLCAAIVLRIAYPVTVTVGTYAIATAYATLGAFLSDIVKAALGTLNLSYGAQRTYKPYSGVQGNQMRNIHRYVLQREVPNNVSFDSTHYTVAGSPYTLNVDILIPFLVHPLKDGDLRLPGWTQMRSMFLEILEGAAFTSSSTGTMARSTGTPVTIDVDVLTIPSEVDRWSPLLTFYKVNATDYEVNGPDGIHLAAWDDNAAFSASAITTFSMLIDTEPIMDTVPPYSIDDEMTDYWVDGGANIDDSETMLLTARWGQGVRDLPAGKITVRQPSLFVSTLKLQGLYWPPISESEAQEAATLGASTAQSAVLLTAHPSTAALPDKHARSSPAVYAKPDDPEFALRPGILVSAPGVTPRVSMPPHVAQSVSSAAAIGAVSGEASANAAEAAALKSVAKQIPGIANVAASAKSVAGTRQVIRDHFARNGVSI